MRCRAFASIGCLSVCVLMSGQSMAQTAGTGTIGKPIQLLQLMHPSHSATKLREKSGAKHVSKSRLAAKEAASTQLAPKEQTSHGAPHITPVVAAAATPQVPSAPTTGAAVRAVAEDAAAAPTPRQGPTMALPRPDNANKIGLATNQQDAPASETLLAAAPTVNATSTEAVTPTHALDSKAAASRTPGDKVGSTFWLLQVMGALGVAVAAGSIAWFLIGWAPPRTVS